MLLVINAARCERQPRNLLQIHSLRLENLPQALLHSSLCRCHCLLQPGSSDRSTILEEVVRALRINQNTLCINNEGPVT
jgi:hypothetical protein